ncbi:MMPL family transporter [Deltaproteobacteria bacterium TL4]
MNWIKIFQRMTHHPWWVISIMLLVTIFFANQSRQHLVDANHELIINTSLDNYINRSSGAYQFFRTIRKMFGNEDVVVVALQPLAEQKFDVSFFLLIDHLTKEFLTHFPGVSGVVSLTNTPQFTGNCAGKSFFHQTTFGSYCESILEKYEHDLQCLENPPPSASKPSSTEESALFEDNNSGTYKEDEASLNFNEAPDFNEQFEVKVVPSQKREEKEEFLCSPDVYEKTQEQLLKETELKVAEIFTRLQEQTLIHRDLISEDFKTAGFIIQFKNNVSAVSAKFQEPFSKLIKSISDQGYRVAFAGQARQQYEASVVLRNDVRVILPLSVLLMIFTLVLAFQSVRGVLIPLLVVVIGGIWTAGIFSLAGETLNPVTMVLPPLLICVGSAYIIFLMHQFYQELHPDKNLQQVIDDMLEHCMLPLTVTALTTIVGFAALIVSPIPAIQSMGIYACVGVAAIIFLSLAFVPSVLTVLKLPDSSKKLNKVSLLDRILNKLSRLVGSHPKHFIVTWIIIGIISVIGLFQVGVNSEATAFKEEALIMQDLRMIENQLAGTDSLRVVMSHPGDISVLQSAKTMLALNQLTQLLTQKNIESEIKQIKGIRIDKVYSVIEYMKIRYPGLHNLSDKEVNYFLEKLQEYNGPAFLSKDHKYFQFTIRMKSSGSTSFLELRQWLEAYFQKNLPELKVQFTGTGVLASESADNIAKSQIQSVILALVIIFVILSILFLSPKMGLIALYPNVVSIAVFFGVLGWLSIPIGITISVIAAIALGIGVDDTIHFLAHYNENVKTLRNERAASELTVRQVGRPAAFTTSALSVGFIVFVISDMESQILFGALLAFTMVVCWIADFNFLPSIMVKTKLITAWDYAELNYTPEMLSKISLFKEMTLRETKLATLMGYPVHLKEGEILFREGEVGKELYVIIEGGIDVYWDAEQHEEETLLVSLPQGAAFGEMGLFRQAKRAASTRASKNTKLLALTDTVLSNVQQRYPLVATKLFLQLAANLYESIHKIDKKLVDYVQQSSSIEEFLNKVNPSEEELKAMVDEIIADGVITAGDRKALEREIYADNVVTEFEQAQLDRLSRLIQTGKVIEEEPLMVNMFHKISPSHLKWLRRRFKTVHVPKNKNITEAPEFHNGMIIVLKGKLSVAHEQKGEIIPLRTVFSGEVFGEEALLFNEVEPTHQIIALEDAELLVLNKRLFDILIHLKKKLFAQLTFNLVSMLSDRLQEVTSKLHE